MEEQGEVCGGFVVGGEVGDGVASGKEESEDRFVGGDVGGGGAGTHGDDVGVSFARGNLVAAGWFLNVRMCLSATFAR